MNKEQTKEAIKIMQAFVDGKEIECSCPLDGRGWETEHDPVWDFDDFYYRIKHEPHYRPYTNAEECFADVKKHGGWVKKSDKGYYDAFCLITTIEPSCVSNDAISRNFNEFVEEFVWADDNSPCGVKEE